MTENFKKENICKICQAKACFKCEKDFAGRLIKYYECQKCHFLQAEDFDSSRSYKELADESNFGSEQRNFKMAKIIGLILKLPLFLENKKILDFGCGQGQLVKQLRAQKYQAFGYDPFLPDEKERFLFADLNELPKEKFNFISCIEVLEHLQNPWDFFDKAGKVLAKNGCIFISTGVYNPQKHKCQWRYINPVAGHISVFSKKALGIFFVKNNFHIVLKISDTVYLVRKNSGIGLNILDFLLKIISGARAELSIFLKKRDGPIQDKTAPMFPIFIVGCSRSGTNLLRLMLNSHPKIAIPQETGLFWFLYHYPGRPKKNWQKLLKELEDPSNLIARALGRPVILQALLKLKKENHLTAKVIISRLFESFLESQKKSIWGEQTPPHVFYIKDILKMFPNAGIVYVLRDPRAVVASMKRYVAIKEKEDKPLDFWMTKDVKKGILMWLDSYKTALKFKSKIHFLKYEDLVKFPEITLKNLTQNYLNILYSPEMLDYYKKLSENTCQWHKFENQKPNLENIDRWKGELSSGEIYDIEAILNKYMKNERYEPENNNFLFLQHFLILRKRIVYVFRNKIKPRLKFVKDYFF